MQLEQYTADAICRSMGLASFVESGWSLPTVRLLLEPSFHPEVCVTLFGPAGASRISVVALAEMFWRQPFPCRLSEFRDEGAVPADAFDQVCADFAATFADRDASGRRVCVDGMRVESCFAFGGDVQRFAEHVYRPAASTLVSRVVRVARESCREPRVRNALAACAKYVGDEYPMDPEPPRPAASGLLVLVLGTPDARAEYFDLLRKRGGLAEPIRAPEPRSGLGKMEASSGAAR